MASGNCCYLVSQFESITGINLPTGCIISINNNINADYTNSCGYAGQTVGSLNISGYASTEAHLGCPGRAGVQVKWLRKYDCELDKVYFIYLGGGRSYIGGEGHKASLEFEYPVKTKIISASSQSGPSSVFSFTEQTEGRGLSYTGTPISFSTASGPPQISNMGLGTGPYYLQNFNIEVVPGSVPVANYTFAYDI